MEHPHAEFLRAIADGERLEDWEWSRFIDIEWGPVSDASAPLAFYGEKGIRFRRKPRTIRIGEFDVPEPVRELLDKHQTYYFVNLWGRVSKVLLADDETDSRLLSLGLIHLTREAAELHRKALLSFTAQEVAE